jgi:hypothetical protein
MVTFVTRTPTSPQQIPSRYNIQEENVVDPATLRLYVSEDSNGGQGGGAGRRTFLLWNEMMVYTLRDTASLEAFPFDVQDLTVDLRLLQTKFWGNFELLVHHVQFHATALLSHEWVLCEPRVQHAGRHTTVVGYTPVYNASG